MSTRISAEITSEVRSGIASKIPPGISSKIIPGFASGLRLAGWSQWYCVCPQQEKKDWPGVSSSISPGSPSMTHFGNVFEIPADLAGTPLEDLSTVLLDDSNKILQMCITKHF